RGTNGNFVLSEFEATIAPQAQPDQATPIKFRAAIADHSQPGYEIHKAIDGQGGRSGWAVDGHMYRVNRTAWFIADKPFGAAGGSIVRLRLRYEYGGKHVIGRVRLATTTSPNVEASPALQALLAMPADQRDDAAKAKVRDHFLRHVAKEEWRALVAE